MLLPDKAAECPCPAQRCSLPHVIWLGLAWIKAKRRSWQQLALWHTCRTHCPTIQAISAEKAVCECILTLLHQVLCPWFKSWGHHAHAHAHAQLGESHAGYLFFPHCSNVTFKREFCNRMTGPMLLYLILPLGLIPLGLACFLQALAIGPEEGQYRGCARRLWHNPQLTGRCGSNTPPMHSLEC